MCRATLVELKCEDMKKNCLKFLISVSHQVLGMLLLKKKYLKHEVRNKCSMVTKEDQGEVDVPVFVVMLELEVFME